MKTGLIIGKFYPLHTGHLALIEKASHLCDRLLVEMQYTEQETWMPIDDRKRIFEQELSRYPHVEARFRKYHPDILPSTSVSDREVSRRWADALLSTYGRQIHIVFGSEPYVQYLAEYMQTPEYVIFDRNDTGISATDIRNQLYKHWEYLPDSMKSDFMLTFIVCGTESTYKTTLTTRLGKHFGVPYVCETARDNGCDDSNTCTSEQLEYNVVTQTAAMDAARKSLPKFIVSDTCPVTTRSYAEFLFQQELNIPHPAPRTVFLFLESDAPFIQDGTRLNRADRDRLACSHKKWYQRCATEYRIPIAFIPGTLEERFQTCIDLINRHIT